MKKIVVSLVAAGALVAGVVATSVITSSTADAQETPVTTDDSTEVEATEMERPERGTAIQEVLDELVASNQISQAQADTIMGALEEKWAELEELRPEGHRHHRGPGLRHGFHLGGVLEDGVIDSDELAALPEGHPFTDPDGPFADAASDGELTQEEIDSVIEQLRADGELLPRPHFGPEFRSQTPEAEGTSV